MARQAKSPFTIPASDFISLPTLSSVKDRGTNLLRLGVEGFSLDGGVVDAVLLTTGDADLHLQPHLHGGHPLEVLDAGGDVLLVKLLGQVQHVAGEQGLVVLLETQDISIGVVTLQWSIQFSISTVASRSRGRGFESCQVCRSLSSSLTMNLESNNNIEKTRNEEALNYTIIS